MRAKHHPIHIALQFFISIPPIYLLHCLSSHRTFFHIYLFYYIIFSVFHSFKLCFLLLLIALLLLGRLSTRSPIFQSLLQSPASTPWRDWPWLASTWVAPKAAWHGDPSGIFSALAKGPTGARSSSFQGLPQRRRWMD